MYLRCSEECAVVVGQVVYEAKELKPSIES